MNFLQPAKSPCLECDDHTIREIDKNSELCQGCLKRFKYISLVDPECLTVFARYGGSGGKTRYRNRRPGAHEAEIESQNLVREFAETYCTLNNLSIKRITETGDRTSVVVSLRRGLIKQIKEKFKIPNRIIAQALGMNPATISLALR